MYTYIWIPRKTTQGVPLFIRSRLNDIGFIFTPQLRFDQVNTEPVGEKYNSPAGIPKMSVSICSRAGKNSEFTKEIICMEFVGMERPTIRGQRLVHCNYVYRRNILIILDRIQTVQRVGLNRFS